MNKNTRFVLGLFGGAILCHNYIIHKLLVKQEEQTETINYLISIVTGLHDENYQNKIDQKFVDLIERFDE